MKYAKIKTFRQTAIEWWEGLSSARKTQLCDTNMAITGGLRRWETLKDRDIEAIWLAESIEAPEDVTPYIEPIEEGNDNFDDVIEKEAEIRYPVLGHSSPNKSPYVGTKKTFKHGCNFGANWQKEQTKALQESHDKLLDALKELNYQLTGDQMDEIELEKGLGITLAMRVKISKTAIENAKNYAKK